MNEVNGQRDDKPDASWEEVHLYTVYSDIVVHSVYIYIYYIQIICNNVFSKQHHIWHSFSYYIYFVKLYMVCVCGALAVGFDKYVS